VDPSQLDGVSVIVGALAAGAGDGLKDVAKGAVTGAAYSVGQGLHHHEASTPSPAADWELFHIRGSVFELRNVGSGTAHDVLLDAPGAVRFDPPGGLSAWRPGSGRELFAVGSMQTGHPRLVVRWKNTASESTHQSWERPLPR